jgi:hypothetical protein
MLARQMPFAAVARIVGESPHRVLAVCQKYVQMACGLADYSDVTALAIDETSRSRGHSYVTLLQTPMPGECCSSPRDATPRPLNNWLST